uniref:T-cell surface antigen CD2-like n=1 Tax=Scatophagus argus TaxID=75038 RepID=UPI001ED84C60|nr:T-cell surface antigen CD2-like [Scatophagus argus]
MYIMACFAAPLGIIILLGFINLSAANKDACELYAAVGQNLTLPLAYDGLETSHVLRWTRNNSVIFYRERGRVSVGKPADITATGSLLLTDLQSSSAGAYKGSLLHPNGTLAKTWAGHLCMMDKVSKPQLNYICDFKSKSVHLNCYVASSQGLVFSWAINEKTLPSETKQKLSISLTQLQGEGNFTCSVANKVSKMKSDTVQPTCKSPTPSPPTMLCFTSKTVLAVLAGGAGLIVLLLTIIIVLCCCLRRNKTENRTKTKEELRMLSVSKREPDSLRTEYETVHPIEDFSLLSPEPSPRACYKSVSQPEAQPENKPPQLSTAPEGQKPSPVPKPRTKGPQTPDI